METHITDARKERNVYLNCVQMAVSDPVRYCHFTFDLSQSVSLPHYGRQMGQIYFMTLRKVQIFGFRKSGNKQLNFLIDEMCFLCTNTSSAAARSWIICSTA
ncbi:hypothetical protein DPMN_105162 [Dreissena polymorpha]|uniref:Uncharacterized protein n=1 Tax=Dreissena polymorpha TaxID=45954 RepID=A0A9D4K0P2_DREPO|nr:hypothetical protein DPMN_105162 [Dreissena polymorpha]